ncbi:MAG: SMP-30/gluconolactonase/LRE family protein [Candidatus Korobacteraceae bacterium]
MKVLATLLAVAVLAGCSSEQPAAKTEAPAAKAPTGVGSIERTDPAFNALVPSDAVIEKVAGGFGFTEGPLWRPSNELWFSDLFANAVRSVTPDGNAKILIEVAGGKTDAPPGSYNGPNGMIADKDGAVLVAQHNDRRIARINKDLSITGVVERFEGKRFNSPNDLVYTADGSLYFTDPPYGLLKQDEDPAKELKFNGVYRFAGGKVTAVVRDMTRPNGIGFSPDGKVAYIANSDPQKKLWMRYDVAANGSLSNGRVFADVTSSAEPGLPDGLKLDSEGNLYATGPGGVWVYAPDGKLLGKIKTPEPPANVGWGEDGKVLYITAGPSVYRIRTAVAGQKMLYQ